MSFSLGQLIVISISYLLLLFAVAWLAERGYVPEKLMRHPLTYTLSLGVYASAWAFYGSVGMAHQSGFAFLTIYLGISGAFLLAPVLLSPILRLTDAYQLSSLADLFAFRFRSNWVGILTTIGMIGCCLPLLVLQIQAVANSIGILSNNPAQKLIALAFCCIIALFSILFGARHIASRQKHQSFVFAIAFESLLKLIALLIIGGYALFSVFGGSAGLEQWLAENPEYLQQLKAPLQDGPWRTLLLVFFASAMVMPHMYHMAFTENMQRKAMRSASWGLPLFLLLMSLPIPIILWAGLKLGIQTPADYFTLSLGINLANDKLALLAYLGGLSASSGVIIVLTLALSGMALNHLVLPFYQPAASSDIYLWLKWMRRTLVLAIMMAAYLLFLIIEREQNLSKLGLIAFTGTLQFLPATLSVLYWQRANRKGFIAGIVAGLSVWALGLLVPLFTDNPQLSLPWLEQSYALEQITWYRVAIASLAVNCIVFIAVSLLSKISPEEKQAALACAINAPKRSLNTSLEQQNPEEFVQQLGIPLGEAVALREVKRALDDLHYHFDEQRPFALRRLRQQIEINLSGLLGPSMAQDIVNRFLPFLEQPQPYASEDIHSIEARLEDYRSRLTGLAAELDTLRRHHRQTLQELPMGVCSLNKDLEILLWNHALERLTGISANRVIGSRLTSIDEPWCSLLVDFSRSQDNHRYKHLLKSDYETRWLNLHKAAIEHSVSLDHRGIVIMLEDTTEVRRLEDTLVHAERLASIGRLAAGIAHEIGNPTTGIACLAQIQRDEYPNDPELVENSLLILEQTQRITRIVQSLMNFTRKRDTALEFAPVALHQVTAAAIRLLQLNKEYPLVNFTNSCHPQHWVLGNEQRLQQVLINLLSNARDASPENATISITSRVQNNWLELLVEDQGAGIAAQHKERLFEPFFTTKDPGQGTGLGLSLVYSIIEEHHGQVHIESPCNLVLNNGTRFIIKLPRYIESPEPMRITHQSEREL